jgi:hypothetical protein
MVLSHTRRFPTPHNSWPISVHFMQVTASQNCHKLIEQADIFAVAIVFKTRINFIPSLGVGKKFLYETKHGTLMIFRHPCSALLISLNLWGRLFSSSACRSLAWLAK